MSEELNQTASDDSQSRDYDAVISKLKEENARLTSSVSKLEGKRNEALDETKKLKRINKLLNTIGIDTEDDEAETLLAEKLLVRPNPPTDTADQADVAPAAEAPKGPDPLMEAELKRLRKQMELLQEQARQSEEEKKAAILRNRQDKIERIVVEALGKAGATNPSHAYKLMGLDTKYAVNLTEEGSVVGGPDYDPKPLGDVIAAVRDDENFSYMFAGSGMSGAGTGVRNGQAASSGGGSNPFRTDQMNLTQAATMWQTQPEKARRLMGEARSAGKLDPKFAALLKS